jgi:hypothetical protein
MRFARVYEWALARLNERKACGITVRLYLAHCAHCDYETGDTKISVERIARIIGTDPGTARKAEYELLEWGLIERSPAKAGKLRGLKVILVDAPQPKQRPAPAPKPTDTQNERMTAYLAEMELVNQLPIGDPAKTERHRAALKLLAGG